MKRCKCGSFALNDHPESGLCDKCWLKKALEDIIAECPNPTLPYGMRVVEIAKKALS